MTATSNETPCPIHIQDRRSLRPVKNRGRKINRCIFRYTFTSLYSQTRVSFLNLKFKICLYAKYSITCDSYLTWHFHPNVTTLCSGLFYPIFSILFFSICVCDVRPPYSWGWNFRQNLFAIFVHSPSTSVQSITEIVPGKLIRRGC